MRCDRATEVAQVDEVLVAADAEAVVHAVDRQAGVAAVVGADRERSCERRRVAALREPERVGELGPARGPEPAVATLDEKKPLGVDPDVPAGHRRPAAGARSPAPG